MMTWVKIDPRITPEHLGFLPSFLDEDDPRPAREQIDANYQHGGGWNPFDGFSFHRERLSLTYPGDPPVKPLAMTKLRDEVIIFYDYSWLLILQPDGTWEVSRVD